MKISVTYEKKDILRLIKADLVAQKIRVKAGTELAYKGALEISLSVETEEPAEAVPAPVPSTAPKAAPVTLAETDDDNGMDMNNILSTSTSLARSTEGKFKRQLAENESYEYPK